MVVIAIAYVATLYGRQRDYDVWHVLLIKHFFDPFVGPGSRDSRWDYWFIEVLVEILVLWAALLSIKAVRGLERAQPFGFAIAFLGVCLVVRFHIFFGEVSMEPYRPHTVVWLFALGWAAARATWVGNRLLLTVAAVCGALLPGFFDEDEGRKLVIAGGLLLLIWVTRVPMLNALQRLTALLAGASLWIYLTQYLTYRFIAKVQSMFDDPSAASGSNADADQPSLRLDLRLAAATVTALAVGVLAWKAYERAVPHLARLRMGRTTLKASRQTASARGPAGG
jgi:hypothetical protein